jgi:hypothetical protein
MAKDMKRLGIYEQLKHIPPPAWFGLKARKSGG